MKLLVVKTSSMGDVIHTLPALSEACAARPDLVIDWAVEPAFSDVVRLHPGVRTIWPTPIRRWRTQLTAAATWREIAGLRRALRGERYDLVLDAQGLFKSAVTARLAGADVAGLDRASARGGAIAALYSRRHAVPPDLHAVDRMRLLFGAALGYAPDLARREAGFATSSGQSRRVFLLHGTTWSSKRWPLAQWVGLARGLLARGYRPAVAFADEMEEDHVRALAMEVPGIEVLGRQTLADFAAALADSAFAVGVDTGLTHLAALLERPTIALYTSTPPGLTKPRGPAVTVLAATTPCAPCRKRVCPLVPAGEDPPCGRTITPAAVLGVVDAWIASNGGQPTPAGPFRAQGSKPPP